MYKERDKQAERACVCVSSLISLWLRCAVQPCYPQRLLLSRAQPFKQVLTQMQWSHAHTINNTNSKAQIDSHGNCVWPTHARTHTHALQIPFIFVIKEEQDVRVRNETNSSNLIVERKQGVPPDKHVILSLPLSLSFSHTYTHKHTHLLQSFFLRRSPSLPLRVVLFGQSCTALFKVISNASGSH